MAAGSKGGKARTIARMIIVHSSGALAGALYIIAMLSGNPWLNLILIAFAVACATIAIGVYNSLGSGSRKGAGRYI